MAKDHVLPGRLLRAAVCVCVLLGSGFLGAGDRWPVVGDECSVSGDGWSVVSDERQRLRAVYMAEVGVREATGGNDGSRVAEYLRYCGLPEGYAWCAAFVSWCHGQAGYAEPRNAWAAALFPASRTVWRTGDGWSVVGDRWSADGDRRAPRTGDVFGIYYSNLKRIGHCGFVDGWDGTWCITVEGNAAPDGAIAGIDDAANPIRAGPTHEGVYRKRRPIRTIRAVARWTR